MRWPWSRREKPTGGADALAEARRREERIDKVVRDHEELRRRNRFGEQIEMTLRGER